MTKPERREAPRKIIEKLAYVNLGPNNGGVVLNVSEGGFCFHAVAPMHQTRTIRFWLSLPDNHRIEAIGELAWTDATRKTGGLRFKSVPAGVREQIRSWAGLPPLPLSTDEDPAAPVPAVPSASLLTAIQSETDVAPPSDSVVSQKASAQKTKFPAPFRWPPTVLAAARRVTKAIPRALAAAISIALAAERSVEKAISTALTAARRAEKVIPRALAVARRLENAIPAAWRAHSPPNFFRSAVTGLLILVLAGALIQLGGLFAGRTLPQTVSSAPMGDLASNPAPETVKSAANGASSLEPENQLRTQIDEKDRQSEGDAEESKAPPRTRSEKSATQLSASVPKPSHASTDATPPATSISPVSASMTSALSAGTISHPISVSADPVASSRFESTHPSVGNPGSTGDLTVGSASLIYFEVGNLKDPVWADKATETLAQSGFHAVVVHKGHLWMNSYHILVGPFANDAAAETAQLNLESHGFKPRATRISPSK